MLPDLPTRSDWQVTVSRMAVAGQSANHCLGGSEKTRSPIPPSCQSQPEIAVGENRVTVPACPLSRITSVQADNPFAMKVSPALAGLCGGRSVTDDQGMALPDLSKPERALREAFAARQRPCPIVVAGTELVLDGSSTVRYPALLAWSRANERDQPSDTPRRAPVGPAGAVRLGADDGARPGARSRGIRGRGLVSVDRSRDAPLDRPRPSYYEPVAIGAVMEAGAVGRVTASEHPGFAVGEHVYGAFGSRTSRAPTARA